LSQRNGEPPGTGLDVAVLDYRMSNLRSAAKALESLGAGVRIVQDGADLGAPDAVVLPGVGHFGEAMARIRAAGLDRAAQRAAEDGRPILGICLGLQLLFDESEESPGVRGLGLLPGAVRRLETDEKVPHIGWSQVHWNADTDLAPPPGDTHESIYYFVHTYAAEPEALEAVLGTANHGVEFVASAGSGRVRGVQFHPEKSSDAGLGLLSRWLHGVAGRENETNRTPK
jgi:glutamine amidotransferase